MTEDPFESGAKSMKKGDTVTCTVSSVSDNGIEVTVAGDLKGFIRRADLSRERSEQRPDRFAVGDRLDARISNISRKDHKLTLSIKAHEVAEEKQVMKEYGSSDSGASLGDILGAVINRKAKTDKTAEEEAPAEKEVEAPPEVEAEAEVPAEAKEQGKKEENPAKKAATKKAKAAPKAKAKAEPKAKAKAKLKAKPKAKAKKVNDSEA
jgi:small subunit ribosomal protein S1